jgi:acyl-CoA reductase-like NAD-dependent aldehyde dehydrogenase
MDSRVDKVSFTGSNAAGRRIATICADRMARLTLELGGKSAGLILDDYDVAKAAETISRSARVLSGQICYAVTRLIVDRKRHDEFVDALASSFGSIKVGDPYHPGSESALKAILLEARVQARQSPQAAAVQPTSAAASTSSRQSSSTSITIR